ncbi:NDUFB8 [Ceraceosorus bombacis]|uniref:NDUFB8 n=1 Tax=Ceraceosorus bombacis TaxID=401625 RepID=A0A0P1BPD1_9BASI|nr:NDUFB8 [Ceraceosorus bombacis]
MEGSKKVKVDVAAGVSSKSAQRPEVHLYAGNLVAAVTQSAVWWDQQEKRNFGETLHESDDELSVWAPDVHKISGPSALFQFSIAAACMGAFAGLVYLTYPEKPAIPRVYPDDGLVKALGEGRKRAPIESDFIKEAEEEEE